MTAHKASTDQVAPVKRFPTRWLVIDAALVLLAVLLLALFLKGDPVEDVGTDNSRADVADTVLLWEATYTDEIRNLGLMRSPDPRTAVDRSALGVATTSQHEANRVKVHLFDTSKRFAGKSVELFETDEADKIIITKTTFDGAPTRQAVVPAIGDDREIRALFPGAENGLKLIEIRQAGKSYGWLISASNFTASR